MSKSKTAQNPDELIHEMKKASINSPLEGINEIYENYYHLIEFIFESGDSITNGAFIGESGFIGTTSKYDGQKLYTEVKKTEGISVGDFCFFSVDLLNFIVTSLDPVCKSNTEVIEHISEFADKYEFGSYEETYNAFVSKYRNLRNLQENSDVELFNVTDSDILLLKFFATMRNFFKVMGSHITWNQEPDVNDYILFNIQRNHKNNYKITCLITKKRYNAHFDVNAYDYKIIDYDEEILDLYPNYWLFEYEDDQSKLIEPIHSSYITVLSEKPNIDD